MKKIIIALGLSLAATVAFSQENMITLSGGYAFANIEYSNVNTTGWRINALYEYNQAGGKWAHGFSLGYVNLSGESSGSLQKTKYNINSWPFYYAPKYLFGSENFKGFIKGAIGWQISNFERSGLVTLSDSDTGFVGGGGAGAQYFFDEKMFLSAEYELLWLSNSFYKDGLLNSASLGIGFRF